MLENVIVLRQTLETSTDTPPALDTEPTLPAPETLGAQFNHRYKVTCTKDVVFIQSSISGRKLPSSQGNVTFKMTELFNWIFITKWGNVTYMHYSFL